MCAPCLHCKAIQTFLKGHWNEMKRTFLRGELLTTLSIPPPRSPNLPLPFLSSPWKWLLKSYDTKYFTDMNSLSVGGKSATLNWWHDCIRPFLWFLSRSDLLAQFFLEYWFSWWKLHIIKSERYRLSVFTIGWKVINQPFTLHYALRLAMGPKKTYSKCFSTWKILFRRY